MHPQSHCGCQKIKLVFRVLGTYNFVTAMKLRYQVVSTIKVIVEFTENMSLTQRQEIFTRISSELKLNEGNRLQSVKLHWKKVKIISARLLTKRSKLFSSCKHNFSYNPAIQRKIRSDWLKPLPRYLIFFN